MSERRALNWPRGFVFWGQVGALAAAWHHEVLLMVLALLLSLLGGVEMELRLRGLSRGGRDNDGHGPR